MASSTASVMQSRSTSRNPPLQAQDQPGGSTARHGSGARFSSREPRRQERGARSRMLSEGGTLIRASQSGPQETADWLAALDASLKRIDTLERYVRGHASIIADLETRLVETNNRVNVQTDLLQRVHDANNGTQNNLGEACTNIIDRFESQDAARALAAKVDVIHSELQALMTAVASYTPLPPDTSQRAQEFICHNEHLAHKTVTITWRTTHKIHNNDMAHTFPKLCNYSHNIQMAHLKYSEPQHITQQRTLANTNKLKTTHQTQHTSTRHTRTHTRTNT